MSADDEEAGEMPAAEAAPRAAVLLVGNELLSGKIRDQNGHFLAQTLRRRGIELVEICTVPDDVARIGAALLRLWRLAPIVFTSGGVGPTHDDVTMDAIAKATRRGMKIDPELLALLQKHYGDDAPEAALGMANIPRGTVLRALPGWPVLRLDPDWRELDVSPDARVYMLPGIPALLQAKVRALEALPGELPRGRGWALHKLRTTVDESALAGPLGEVVAAHPGVEIGSYPRWAGDGSGRRQMEVQLTFEAASDDAAQAARDAMAEKLGSETLLPLDDE